MNKKILLLKCPCGFIAFDVVKHKNCNKHKSPMKWKQIYFKEINSKPQASPLPKDYSTFENPKVEESFRKLKKIVKEKNIDTSKMFRSSSQNHKHYQKVLRFSK